MPVGEVRVRGLRECQLALKRYDAELATGLRVSLRALGEPVRQSAESNASALGISNAWQRMRVGATAKTVYVAPKSRRRQGSPRPKLAPLLMQEAMQPALEEHTHAIVEGLDHLLDKLADRSGLS